MITRLKTILILISIIISYNIFGQNQEFSKNSIKVGVGLGVSMGKITGGGGFVYTIGYQREIWKDRLRLNPNFSFGHYSSIFIIEAQDQYFNSISIETNLYYDLIKGKSFSLVVGCGGLVNNTRGQIDYGGKKRFVSDLYFGGYLGGGFRINSPDKRIAINIMPINLHYGINYFVELHAKIELDIKL